jgi:hypothetical protein
MKARIKYNLHSDYREGEMAVKKLDMLVNCLKRLLKTKINIEKLLIVIFSPF